MNDWADAAMLLNSGRVQVDQLVEEQTFDLAHIQDALKLSPFPAFPGCRASL